MSTEMPACTFTRACVCVSCPISEDISIVVGIIIRVCRRTAISVYSFSIYLFCIIVIIAIAIVNRAEVDKSSRRIAEIELLIIVLIN